MNIAMEQTEEYVNGQLKNKYGDAFIRGNNGNPNLYYFSSYLLIYSDSFIYNIYSPVSAVLYISTSKRTLADSS